MILTGQSVRRVPGIGTGESWRYTRGQDWWRRLDFRAEQFLKALKHVETSQYRVSGWFQTYPSIVHL
jgi:hypothetical protein